MRIIAGSRKGARISRPKGPRRRPTGDRVREAVFNLDRARGRRRGARSLRRLGRDGPRGALARRRPRHVFVEADRAAAVDRAQPREARARAARRSCARTLLAGSPPMQPSGRRYDLVLIDPPYRMLAQPADARPTCQRSSPDGLVVVESDARRSPSFRSTLRTSRRYGSARVTVFEGLGPVSEAHPVTDLPGQLRPGHERPPRHHLAGPPRSSTASWSASSASRRTRKRCSRSRNASPSSRTRCPISATSR